MRYLFLLAMAVGNKELGVWPRHARRTVASGPLILGFNGGGWNGRRLSEASEEYVYGSGLMLWRRR